MFYLNLKIRDMNDSIKITVLVVQEQVNQQ